MILFLHFRSQIKRGMRDPSGKGLGGVSMEKGVPTSRDKVGSRKRRIIRPTLGNTKKKPTPGYSSPSVSPTEDKIEKEGLVRKIRLD